MYQKITTTKVVANSGNAMEAETIQNNAASPVKPKEQEINKTIAFCSCSRYGIRDSIMKNLFTISLITIVCCLCLASCGNSPKKQGEKLGQEYCDCQKEYAKEQEKVYQSFLAKFDSYGFRTRPEARHKWQDVQNEASQKFEECKGKVEGKKRKAESEFPTGISNLLDPKTIQKYSKNPQKYLKEFTDNQKKANEFQNAYRNAINKCDVPKTEINNSDVEVKIGTIIPQKPDVTNLKHNLVRRRITEQPGGYFGNSWAWQINSVEEIQSIRIEKEEKVGNDYEIDVHLVLQKNQSAQYEADLTLICVLGQADDDWRIDFIKTKDIFVTRTGRYNDCITTEQKRNWGGTFLQFTNNCDVALIVGGQMLGNNDEWTKFSAKVNANGVGSTSYSGKECKIDFIERQ